jgi:parallel beta-helix repeat protein
LAAALVLLMTTSMLLGAANTALANGDGYHEVWVDADYSGSDPQWFDNIGDALAALASDSESAKVYIYAGTYQEHVRIDRSDTAILAEEAGVIIDGSGSGPFPDAVVITENAGKVNLTGLTIQGASGTGTVAALNIRSFDNRIEGCTIKDSDYGVLIYQGSGNRLVNCTIKNNAMDGIYAHADYLRLYGTQVLNCTIGGNAGAGIRLEGDPSDEYVKGTLVENCTVELNGAGIWTEEAARTTVRGSEIAYNDIKGIYLGPNTNGLIEYSESKIYENLIGENGHDNSDGTGYGVEISEDKGRNRIYRNDFVNNEETPQAYDGDSSAGDGDDNNWDSTPLDGSPAESTLGNYWSDFQDRYPAAGDGNGDGIWDHPDNKYGLATQGGVTLYSYYPLVYPQDSYTGTEEVTETGTVSFDIDGATDQATGPEIEAYDVPPYEQSTLEFELDYTTDWGAAPMPTEYNPTGASIDGTGSWVGTHHDDISASELGDGDAGTEISLESDQPSTLAYSGLRNAEYTHWSLKAQWGGGVRNIQTADSCLEVEGMNLDYGGAFTSEKVFTDPDSEAGHAAVRQATEIAYDGEHIKIDTVDKAGLWNTYNPQDGTFWSEIQIGSELPSGLSQMQMQVSGRWKLHADTGNSLDQQSEWSKLIIYNFHLGSWETVATTYENNQYAETWASELSRSPTEYLSLSGGSYIARVGLQFRVNGRHWDIFDLDTSNSLYWDYASVGFKPNPRGFAVIDVTDIADAEVFLAGQSQGYQVPVYDQDWNHLLTLDAGSDPNAFDSGDYYRFTASNLEELRIGRVVPPGGSFTADLFDISIFDRSEYDTSNPIVDEGYFDFDRQTDPPIPSLDSITAKDFSYSVVGGGSYTEDLTLSRTSHDDSNHPHDGSYLYQLDTDQLSNRDVEDRLVVSGQSPQLEFSLTDNPGYHFDLKIRYNHYYWQAFPETIELDTPTGYNVRVEDESGFSLTFDEVTSEGTTTVSTEVLPENDPAFEVAGKYHDVETTAIYEDQVEVGMPYDEASLPVPEEDLRIYHHDDDTGEWVDATSWVDVTNDIVYATVDHFSGFVLGYERDPTPPDISVEYKDGDSALAGDRSDGNPGVWEVNAHDEESGIDEELTEVYLDGELVGTELGTYAVPKELGTHSLEVRASNNNPAGAVEASETVFVNVVDDDTAEPYLRIDYFGSGEDDNAGRFEWEVTDEDDGIGDGDPSFDEIEVEAGYAAAMMPIDEWRDVSSASAGSWDLEDFWGIPELGYYALRVTATDGDDDRPGDSLTSCATKIERIADDDTTAPTIESAAALEQPVYDDEDSVTIEVRASDASGISEAAVKFDGVVYGDADGDGIVSIPNPRTPGEYDFEATAYDADEDRPGDRLSTTTTSSFEVVDDDTANPTIDWEYTGDGTDGNPGTVEVSASDASGLALDPSGTYEVPNELGTHSFTFEATDADDDRPGDSLSKAVTVTIDIADDDTTAPIIEITHTGSATDGDPGAFEWDITDTDDGIGGDGDTGFAEISVQVLYESSEGLPNETYDPEDAPSGTFELPPYLGDYTLEVFARDADDDRGITDSLTATLFGGETVEDDDTESPSITSAATLGAPVYDDEETIDIAVEASDASGIHQIRIDFGGTTYLDSDGDGKITLPNPTVPGEYGYEVTAVDDDDDRPGDRLSAAKNFIFEVVDDDTTPPAIRSVSAGTIYDDHEDIELSINATDGSGIHSLTATFNGTTYEDGDGDGKIILPNPVTPGTYGFSVTAADADLDRPGDQLSTTETFDFEVLDDDSKAPAITNFETDADWRTVNVSFDATDESGIHSIELYVEGEEQPGYEEFVEGSSHLLVLENSWIKRDGNYTVRVEVTDGDDDRPGDRLTATETGEFEVSLRDMYDYVIAEVDALERYALNASAEMGWLGGMLFENLVARPLNWTERELGTAYELISAGNTTEGLMHDIYAQILVKITDMRVDLFEWFGVLDNETAEHFDTELKEIRDDIVLLMGASTRELAGYEMALVEVDLFHLADHIREDIIPSVGAHGWRELGRVASLHRQVKGAAIDLEIGIVSLTCGVNETYTEGALNRSRCHLERAMDSAEWLLDKGDIDQETYEDLLASLEGSVADIEEIESGL